MLSLLTLLSHFLLWTAMPLAGWQSLRPCILPDSLSNPTLSTSDAARTLKVLNRLVIECVEVWLATGKVSFLGSLKPEGEMSDLMAEFQGAENKAPAFLPPVRQDSRWWMLYWSLQFSGDLKLEQFVFSECVLCAGTGHRHISLLCNHRFKVASVM